MFLTFVNEKLNDIIELTEGYFNVAYKVSAGEKSYILKIAPSKDTDVMTYEKNIMFSEVDSLRMIKEKTKSRYQKYFFMIIVIRSVIQITSLWKPLMG